MVFEEYGFRSFLVAPAQPLSLRAWAAARPPNAAASAGVGLVVDAGFSFTHAVPVCDGRVLSDGVRRINLGGKALTNYLKELVSYRCVRDIAAPSFMQREHPCSSCACPCSCHIRFRLAVPL
jgi:actin-related protein 6